MCTVVCMNVCACVNVPVEWAYACERRSRWSSDESKVTIAKWASEQMTLTLMMTAAAVYVCKWSAFKRCGPYSVL